MILNPDHNIEKGKKEIKGKMKTQKVKGIKKGKKKERKKERK